MKMYVVQSENGTIINANVTVKKPINLSSSKNVYTWNPNTCDGMSVIEHVKLVSILISTVRHTRNLFFIN